VDPLVLHLPDGRVIEARPKLVLGRDPRCGCPVDDPAVSTLHATIDRDPNGWFIEDMKSLNGTWVREERIQRRTAIGPGDVVRLGGTTIRVGRGAGQSGGAAAPAAGSPSGAAPGVSDTQLASDNPEALLGVGRKAGPEEILARFEKLAGDLKQKIQHAPTPALRRMYQRQLNDLTRAKDTLLRG
jgi:pSer/pThr/pTyr-binding forkhead associated (FHA) protein